MTVAIVDLGVGNTASVAFALARLGTEPRLARTAEEISNAEKLIVPGVGSARFAMDRMEARGLSRTIREFPRPVLGLCLGQQLLYESSEEGDACGLGILAGRVYRLEAAPERPVPHMGWNRLTIRAADLLLDGIEDGAFVYFVHSYACPVSEATLATADYGGDFCAMVHKKNYWGCQFHPERSSKVGSRILANFLALPC